MLTFILMVLVTFLVLGSVTAYITWENLDRKQKSLFMDNIQMFKQSARKFIKERI